MFVSDELRVLFKACGRSVYSFNSVVFLRRSLRDVQCEAGCRAGRLVFVLGVIVRVSCTCVCDVNCFTRENLRVSSLRGLLFYNQRGPITCVQFRYLRVAGDILFPSMGLQCFALARGACG